MLDAWDALRDADEGGELRLARLLATLRACRSLELCLALLRVLVVMLEGPADGATPRRGPARDERDPLPGHGRGV